MGYNSKQLKVKYHTKDAPNPKPNPYKGDKQINPVVDKSYFDHTGNGMRDPRIKALAQQFGIPVTIPGQSMGTDGYGNDMPLRVTPNYADGSQGPEYTKYPNTGNHSFPGAVSFTERMASGGQTNSDIARAILEDGMVYGHSLSDIQREHMAEQAGVELDEDGNIVEANDTDTESNDDTAELDNARRGGQKKRRSKTSSNPVTGINDLMMRNETIYGKSGKRRFVPKLQQGGWLDKYQPGGMQFDDGGETGMLPYKMGGHLNQYQTKGEVNVPTIEYTNEMGSQYDPVIQTVYINPKDPEQAKIHELWHHYQNVNDWNRSYDAPMMKKPQTPASDEMIKEYYNRASNEANELTKGFKQRYPEFNMVPNDVIYNRQVENQMYQQPWTIEGEGRAVESPEGKQWLSDEGYDMQEFEDLANRSGIDYNKKQLGGWLDHYQDGGTVSELWEQKTGTPWSEAKKQGLTDGSYEGNMKVRDMLVKGNISKPKPKVISTKPKGPRIDSSLMGQPNFASETVQSQAPMSKYAAAEQNKAASKGYTKDEMIAMQKQWKKEDEEEKLRKAKVVSDRKLRIANSNAANNEDLIGNPNWRNVLANQTQATGDKLRISNEENIFDDYINPAAWIGNMASRLGSSPKEAEETNSYMPYVKAIGEPLAMGAIGEIAEPYIKKGLNNAGKVLDTSLDVTKSIPIVYRDSQFKNKLTIGFGKSKQTFNNSIEWKKAFDAERAAGVERPLLKKEINFLNKEIKDRGILEIDRRHPLDPRQPLVKRGLLPEDYDMKKAVKDFIPNLIKGDVKSQYTMGIGRENAFNQYLGMPTKDNMYRIHPESFTNGNEMIYTVPHNKLVQLSKNNAKAGVSSFAPSKASMQELQIAKESLTNNSKEFNKKAYDVIKKRMEQSYDNDAIEEILGPKNKFVYDITNPDYGADMSGGMSRIKNGTSYINDLDLYTNAHGNAYWENKNIPGSRNQSWKMIDTWDINPFSRMTNKPKWVQNLDVAPIIGAKNFTLNLDYITTPSGITKPLIPKKLGGWLDKYK